jgi:hypothetical protein
MVVASDGSCSHSVTLRNVELAALMIRGGRALSSSLCTLLLTAASRPCHNDIASDASSTSCSGYAIPHPACSSSCSHRQVSAGPATPSNLLSTRRVLAVARACSRPCTWIWPPYMGMARSAVSHWTGFGMVQPDSGRRKDEELDMVWSLCVGVQRDGGARHGGIAVNGEWE